MLLQLRGDGDGLAGEQRRDPFGRPGALAGIIDARQRLQGDGRARVVGQRAAEIVPVAAHGERGRADRAAEIEGEDLRAGIAAELQRHQRQQHALAGAGRADDQRVADIADMEAEKRNGVDPSVRAKNSGGAWKCSSRSGPAQTAENGIMCARLSVETGGWRTLA